MLISGFTPGVQDLNVLQKIEDGTYGIRPIKLPNCKGERR